MHLRNLHRAQLEFRQGSQEHPMPGAELSRPGAAGSGEFGGGEVLLQRGDDEKETDMGLIVTSALMIWKGLMCITGSESPIVVVLSESMEPGFARGDILFLRMSKEPIRAGEIVVYNINGRDIPIVHRVIKVHERKDTGEVDVLTKGDNNGDDDIGLYAPGQRWLQRKHIIGRAVGTFFSVDWGCSSLRRKTNKTKLDQRINASGSLVRSRLKTEYSYCSSIVSKV
ncbi:hypothetical protein SASPL_110236 [Salvia splendens]|uniref:Signal peptidase complex catalytic subunit SEC11 n=1 Tax=Salvia splendens TaxID=180675 RepID=A0A8X8Y532_SALSN|nr:hypothetical protein SASPL_110236 [Salvia splendens]